MNSAALNCPRFKPGDKQVAMFTLCLLYLAQSNAMPNCCRSLVLQSDSNSLQATSTCYTGTVSACSTGPWVWRVMWFHLVGPGHDLSHCSWVGNQKQSGNVRILVNCSRSSRIQSPGDLFLLPCSKREVVGE